MLVYSYDIRSNNSNSSSNISNHSSSNHSIRTSITLTKILTIIIFIGTIINTFQTPQPVNPRLPRFESEACANEEVRVPRRARLLGGFMGSYEWGYTI